MKLPHYETDVCQKPVHVSRTEYTQPYQAKHRRKDLQKHIRKSKICVVVGSEGFRFSP